MTILKCIKQKIALRRERKAKEKFLNTFRAVPERQPRFILTDKSNEIMAKDADYNRMIHTARWLRLRKAVLSEHPLCERCAEDGRITPAGEVHHRVPVEHGMNFREKEKLMFDPSNLTALCHRCHVEVHTEMGRSGRERMRQLNAAKTSAIIRKFFGEEGG